MQAVQDELRSERATLQLLLTALEDATLDQTKQLQVAYDELKVQGEMVQSSEERLRLAQQAARMASWDWNLETDAVSWDEGSAKTYGRPAAEMASMQQILRYIDEDDAARVWADLSHAVAGRGNYSSTYKVCWPDGTSRWIQAFGEIIFSGDKPARVVGVNLDVTERKIAEQARCTWRIRAVTWPRQRSIWGSRISSFAGCRRSRTRLSVSTSRQQGRPRFLGRS